LLLSEKLFWNTYKEIIGTTACLLDKPRATTAIAETEPLLLVIDPYVFEELLHINPSFSRDIIQLLCDRLHT
jgi:CRP-like cAMP-binding protein